MEWELLFVWNQLTSWVLPLCQEVAPANVKSETILSARDGERITGRKKITSCGMLARAAFLRGTEPPPLREHSGFRACLFAAR